MAKNIIKTLQGKSLDMGELALRNEKVTAVGNMQQATKRAVVKNTSVATNTRRPGKGQLRRQISEKVEDAPVMESLRAAKVLVKKYMELAEKEVQGLDEITKVDNTAKKPIENNPTVTGRPPAQTKYVPTQSVETTQPATKPIPAITKDPIPMTIPKKAEDLTVEVLEKVIEKAASKPQGLAGAIAKAREVKQEPLKTQREEARSVDGVKRI